jgi:hypothetical protein
MGITPQILERKLLIWLSKDIEVATCAQIGNLWVGFERP